MTESGGKWTHREISRDIHGVSSSLCSEGGDERFRRRRQITELRSDERRQLVQRESLKLEGGQDQVEDIDGLVDEEGSHVTQREGVKMGVNRMATARIE